MMVKKGTPNTFALDSNHVETFYLSIKRYRLRPNENKVFFDPHYCEHVLMPPQNDELSFQTKIMRDKYGVTIAGGQGHLKGKIFRIAHLGYMIEFDTLTAISALEIALKELGYKFNIGSGAGAALKIFTS